MNRNETRLHVLLIEDADGRTESIRDALQQPENRCELQTIDARQYGVRHLRGDGPFAAASTPDLVLFDLSNADKRRLKILDRVQADTSRRDISLAVLTRPDSERLLEKAYNGQSGCIMFSPIKLDSFLKKIRSSKPGRILKAVSLFQELGFVRVRVPSELVNTQGSGSSASETGDAVAYEPGFDDSSDFESPTLRLNHPVTRFNDCVSDGL